MNKSTFFLLAAYIALLTTGGCQHEGFPKSPLETAIEQSDLSGLRQILLNKVDPNTRFSKTHGNSQNNTVLHLAVEQSVKQYEVVKLLVSAGASPDLQDSWGRTVLHIAIKRGADTPQAMETFNLLCQKSTSVNRTMQSGLSPLHECAEHNRLDHARVLIAFGADPNLQNDAGWTPAHFAALYDSLEVLAYLKEIGADFELQNSVGDSVFEVMRSRKAD